LGVPSRSIRNWRDEFDPVHDNSRQGWRNRKMHPSRSRVVQALSDMTEPALLALVRGTMKNPHGSEARILAQVIGEEEEDDGAATFSLRGPTGKMAEEAFERHHARTGDPAGGALLDRRHEQCGFDYEIASDGVQAFVEVKGLAGHAGGVTFTDKEWATARSYGDRYFLAVVRNVVSQPRVSIYRNPGYLFDAIMRVYPVVQVGWSIGEKALRGVKSSSL
jgi:hypothetical protein